LQGFDGALVTVSHDRFLLETVTDQFYLVANQQVKEFDGDLNDYRKWLDARRLESQPPTEPGENKSRKGQRQVRAAKREQLKPLLRAVARLEKELERYSIESAALDEKLTDSSLYDVSSKGRLTELMKEKGRVDNKLEEVEMLWLEAGEALEAAQEVLTTYTAIRNGH